MLGSGRKGSPIFLPLNRVCEPLFQFNHFRIGVNRVRSPEYWKYPENQWKKSRRLGMFFNGSWNLLIFDSTCVIIRTAGFSYLRPFSGIREVKSQKYLKVCTFLFKVTFGHLIVTFSRKGRILRLSRFLKIFDPNRLKSHGDGWRLTAEIQVKFLSIWSVGIFKWACFPILLTIMLSYFSCFLSPYTRRKPRFIV